MKIIRTVSEMQAAANDARAAGKNGKKIVFVPTMGALHEGHCSLFRIAKKLGSTVVVSIFVNPTQFNDPKDLEKYPRDLAKDLDGCRQEGVDLVFAPTPVEIYPDGLKITVKAPPVAQPLEGVARPGHFDGVATVVVRLFSIVQPRVAIFGEKDYQQLLVIRHLVKALQLPIEIVGAPTVRTPEGLAMSSRNARLTQEGLQAASTIPMALADCHHLFESSERSVSLLEGCLTDKLHGTPGLKIDYAQVVDSNTLESIQRVTQPAIAAVAVIVEGIRLIDNTLLDPLD